VTADSVAQDAARHERVLVLPDGSEDGQSAAAGIGVRHALTFDFDRALMVAGDTPLLDPRQVSDLLRRAERERLGVVVVPDRHGTGTNALLLSPPDAIDPGFGPGSRERHELRAHTLGVPCAVDAVPSLVLDVDTPEDLDALAAELDRRHGLAPLTRGTLRQLDRTQARRQRPAPAPAAALPL
jgi:2-phospho-L-lactate guanylyltransferase